MNYRYFVIGIILAVIVVGYKVAQDTSFFSSRETAIFNTSAEEIAARKVGEEIVSLRTENTQVFKAENGELNAKIYLKPVNYFDTTDSTYKPIDTSVHKISALDTLNPFKTYDEFVDAGIYRAEWFADKPWDYKMYVGDSWIQYEALFDESASLSIKLDILDIGIKETVILKDSTAPTTLQWNVTQSTGKSAIITPPPTAVDAEGKNIPVSESKIGNVLTYEVDTTGAVFPVMVDPTSITTENDGSIYTSKTTYAAARDATTGTGDSSSDDVRVGQAKMDATTFRNYRGFLSFPFLFRIWHL